MIRSNTRAAFTLIEILVVIAIMGIVMAVGIPTLHRRFNPDSVDQAVRDMMEACSHARAYAILQSVPVDLIIRGEDGQISLQPSGSTGVSSEGRDYEGPSISALEDSPARAPTPAVSAESLNFHAKLSEKIAIELMEVNFQDQMEYTEARVRFYPNGTSDEFKMLLFHAESGQKRLVTLEVVTALADVESDPQKWR